MNWRDEVPGTSVRASNQEPELCQEALPDQGNRASAWHLNAYVLLSSLDDSQQLNFTAPLNVDRGLVALSRVQKTTSS
jgi:hypothetical protein